MICERCEVETGVDWSHVDPHDCVRSLKSEIAYLKEEIRDLHSEREGARGMGG